MTNGGALEIPPPDFRGRGTMRSMVEGFFGGCESPSTTLRVVPLPGKCRGGFPYRASTRTISASSTALIVSVSSPVTATPSRGSARRPFTSIAPPTATR